METTPRTRLAILGTLFDLHRELLPYDLAALRQLVVELAPEILCAEITKGTWEAGDLTSAEVEVREALAPVVAVTDTVLVPVAPTEHQFLDFAPRAGWRWSLVRALERLLRWGQRGAGTPEAVNGFLSYIPIIRQKAHEPTSHLPLVNQPWTNYNFVLVPTLDLQDTYPCLKDQSPLSY